MAEIKLDDKWKAEHRIAEHKPVYLKDFKKMSYKERLELYKNNRELYESLASSEKMEHQTYNHSEVLQSLSQKVHKVMIIRKG